MYVFRRRDTFGDAAVHRPLLFRLCPCRHLEKRRRSASLIISATASTSKAQLQSQSKYEAGDEEEKEKDVDLKMVILPSNDSSGSLLQIRHTVRLQHISNTLQYPYHSLTHTYVCLTAFMT